VPVSAPIEKSSFYRALKAENDEIDRIKWLESEKSGHDIGILKARWLWVSKYKSLWYRKTWGSGKK
jgi:hypothetical protein